MVVFDDLWLFMVIYGDLLYYRFLGLLAIWRLGFSVFFGLFMSMI